MSQHWGMHKTKMEATYALDGGGKRTENDEVVQLPGLVPAVRALAAKDVLVLLGELREALERGRVLRHERALLELGREVLEAVAARELGSVGHEGVVRDALERVDELRVRVVVDGVDVAHGGGVGLLRRGVSDDLLRWRGVFLVFVRHGGRKGQRKS